MSDAPRFSSELLEVLRIMGYAVVPIRPTERMIRAGKDAKGSAARGTTIARWQAMVATAQIELELNSATNETSQRLAAKGQAPHLLSSAMR